MRGQWWRIDADHPADWRWDGFPAPRHRFDPTSGRFRVRYAANQTVAAARERFPARLLTESDGDLYLVSIEIDAAVLPLTRQENLDGLAIDDRVNTGRLDRPGPGGDPLLDVCQELADAVFDWWKGSPPPLVYRTRSSPNARSVAFTESASVSVLNARPLREAGRLHAQLVGRHGFTVPVAWLR